MGEGKVSEMRKDETYVEWVVEEGKERVMVWWG